MTRAAVRFEQRRSDVVAAAIPILNSQGFKGMHLTAVAEQIGLRSTGVTYYFPRKEDLAVACIESGFAVMHEILAVAEREPDAKARIARLIELFVERDAAVRLGQSSPLASFGSIMSLEGAYLQRVVDGYGLMFRRVRRLFVSDALAGLPKGDVSIRTVILLEQLYWSNAWLGDHDLSEFPRLARRITDIVIHGIALPGDVFAPRALDLHAPADEADASKDNFLLAAIRQINAHGYRGASVDRIAASLNRTKGAFYHHNHAKDDIVAAGFRRSFGIIRDAQREVRRLDTDEWTRLTTAVTELMRFQFGSEGPLLRTSVLASMPPEYQVEIVDLSYRASRSFAAMVADSVAEGKARAVDPTVASHMLSAAVNVASEFIPMRAAGEALDPAAHARPIFHGLLNR